MDASCIFKRIEKKYLLSETQYEALMGRVGAHLRPDAFGRSTVMSLYLDTPDWFSFDGEVKKPDLYEFTLAPVDGGILAEVHAVIGEERIPADELGGISLRLGESVVDVTKNGICKS